MSLSFYDWCIENKHDDLLDMWDYKLNDCSPSDVTYRSDKRICLTCGNPLHPIKRLKVASITAPNRTGLTKDRICVGCHSVGQYFLDNFGQEYLDSIWSNKNTKSPFEVALNSKSVRIWLRCLSDSNHSDYDLTAGNVVHAFGCPFCRNRKIYDGNNLGKTHPEVYKYWSDKNIKPPTEYVETSHAEAWFSCPILVHPDYKREIRHEVRHRFICPICLRIEAAQKGPDHPRFLGNQTENSRQRSSSLYRHWRDVVFKRDDYTCQCCGKRGCYLNCHHIYSFASNEELRFHPYNGITLCEQCHSIKFDGSLHYNYGIRDVTPQQLEEYINNKRKELGITDPFYINKYIDKIDPLLIQKSA